MNSALCSKCMWTYEFYGRIVPPCPKCGCPELKTREEQDETYRKTVAWGRTPPRRFRFVAGLCTPVGFTDGRIYDAWPDTFTAGSQLLCTRNDKGYQRVFQPDQHSAHCIPEAARVLPADMKCYFEEVFDDPV